MARTGSLTAALPLLFSLLTLGTCFTLVAQTLPNAVVKPAAISDESKAAKYLGDAHLPA